MATKTKAKVTEAPKTKVEKFSQTLKVPLTPQELLQRGSRAADLVAQITESDLDMKAAQKAAKSRIETLEAELGLISNEVRSKATYRMVECENHFVYERGVKETLRMDSGELIGSVKLTEREMQLDLDFDSANGNGHANDDQSWRPVPILEALEGAGKRAFDAFEKKGIATMGDFSDFQAKHGDFWVKELPDVGPETAEKISEASIAFWARWKPVVN